MRQTEPQAEQQPLKAHPIPTAPLTEGEIKLLEKFHEDIARQSDRMDDLAKQLITLELAIPGLYATVLKLVNGDKAVVQTSLWFWATLVCWLVALIFALVALIPRYYAVATHRLEGEDPETGAIGVKDYFTRSAGYKRWLLIGSSVTFFLGIMAAIFAMT